MSGETTSVQRGVVFVLSGHGSQWSRMAGDLLDTSPVFASSMQACELVLKSHLGWSLIDVLRGSPGAAPLQRVDVVQPVLFAVTVSLAELWQACGVRPQAVVGHSQGEVAAAYIAGGLSLAEAATVVAQRSMVLAQLSGRGGMIALTASLDLLESQIGQFAELDLGAVNGPASFAVGGVLESLDALLTSCRANEIRAGRVAIDYPSHSRHIEPLRARMLEVLSSIAPRSGEIPFFSTVTGEQLDTAVCDAEYWYRGERQTVQFEPAVRALLQGGHSTFLEVSPHPVLAAAIQETVDATIGEQTEVLVASSLRRGQGDAERFWAALNDVSMHGVAVDWESAREAIGAEDQDHDKTERDARRRLRGHDPATEVTATRSIEKKSSLVAKLAQKTGSEQGRIVSDAVATEVASVLGLDLLDEAMEQQAFTELGLDSSGVVELRNRLRAITGLRLSATLVFDHPTPVALAHRVLEELTLPRLNRAAHVATASTAPLADSEEAIAIVGMSCRFPGGVNSPRDLWELLARGGDAIGDFPTDRGWDLDGMYDPDPDKPGKTYTREGGFLYDAGRFDAGFFGISPREALAMDPQQRLLLEACWEAFEAGGLDSRSMAGTQTGVYAGINRLDYNPRLWLDPDGLEGYNMTGGSASVIAGRVSYVFGLQGPALTVDTACSSSLVAMHLACGALRRSECSLALAGGVSIMATPGLYAAFSRQRALAWDGRCKSFADSADGTGWGEGVGVLLLERLQDARRNGRRVLALVRGSAINQDGASNGLTAPNGLAQQQVIRQALQSSGLAAADIDVVEAHGTGTKLGDPIEAHALLATYGQERTPEHPLWLGSIKSNIGHTQAAAGVAGVIKMVMSMRNGVLPKTLHVDEPSGEIDWSEGNVALLVEQVDWPAGETPRRAGASSYGISGTNAHVILEEAPASSEGQVDPEVSRDSPAPLSWVLSARGQDALLAQAARLDAFLGTDDSPAAGDAGPEGSPTAEDVGLSLTSKSLFEHRAVVLGESLVELHSGVAALACGERAPEVIRGVARGGTGRLAFMFTGQGAQRFGMGAELYRSLPLFAETFDQVCAHMDDHLGRSLRAVVMGIDRDGADGSTARAPIEDTSTERVPVGDVSAQAHLIDDTMFTQAGLFALEIALYRQVRAWGVKPDFLIGHSIGELAAAFVAGVFSMEDACRLVAARGRLMSDLPRGGAMFAIGASESEVAEMLIGQEDRLSLAGINGPSSVVISGEEQAAVELARTFDERGRKTKRLRVSHAFHSPRMDGMLDAFRRVAESVSFNEPSLPLLSNVTGEAFSAELCTPDYWVRHVREPVRFADGIKWLCGQGVDSFLELGPDGVLSGMANEQAASETEDEQSMSIAVTVMRRDRSEARALQSALGEIWVRGADVDWAMTFDGLGAHSIELPTYPFQRQHYWIEAHSGVEIEAFGQASAHHPLLGAAVAFAEEKGWLFTGRLSLRSQKWLADHVVYGTTLLPGSALLELALHVAGQVGCAAVQELTIQAPLVLPEHDWVRLQVAVGEVDEAGRRSIRIHSRSEDSEEEDEPSTADVWVCHAVGMLAPSVADLGSTAAGTPQWTETAWPPRGAVSVDVQELYDRMDEEGLESGPAFRCLRSLWRRAEETFAEVALPEGLGDQGQSFALHPALLDGALQALGAGMLGADVERDEERIWLPFSWSGVTSSAAGESLLRVRLARVATDTVSLLAVDDNDVPVLSADSLALRKISAEQLRQSDRAGHDSLFTLDWEHCEPASDKAASMPTSVIIGPADGTLAAALDDLEVFADVASLSERISQADGAEIPHTAFVDLMLDGENTPATVHARAHLILDQLQRWLADERLSDSRVVFVTRNALATVAGEAVSDLPGGAAWGLVRSAQSENPGRFVLVDLDGELSSLQSLLTALPSGESQLAIRAGGAMAPRFARLAPSEMDSSRTTDFGSDETVLVTGGTGGLGAMVARHLVANHGVRHLLLASRRGARAEGADELERELSGLGAKVNVAACDVTDRAQVELLLEGISKELPLRAVIHVAGTLDDGVIDALTPERIDAVLAPKVDAAWHLHELTTDMQLREFVVFSSIAGVMGSSGQGNYAAGNAYLDSLISHRRAQGLPGVSLAWGLWAEASGMRRALGDTDLARVARAGMVPLSSDEGLQMLDLARAGESALVIPVRLDRRALRGQAAAGSLPTLLRGLFRGVTSPTKQEAGGALAGQLGALSEDERERKVLQLVRAETARVLGYSAPEEIEAERAFKDIGFDSLVGVELRNQLAGASGLRLPVTLVFDHPSPGAVARYLLEQLKGSEASASTPHSSTSTPSSASATRKATAAELDDPIAIVGMSCRYPGGVSSPEALWQLVLSGRDAIGGFPTDRGWEVERLYDPDPEHSGTSYTREGGFLYDAGDFDPAFFGIGPREALAMDPQQRLMLEVCWETVERAGIAPSSLRGSATGVFTGVMYHDYGSRLGDSAPADLEAYLGVGSAGSVASGRTAYVLGLEGPAVTVDTACSSSLVAMHWASQALRSGECALALAGGVTVLSTPGVFLEFSRQRGLSPDGRCKSFANGADGTGWGEGVGMLLLERLSDARRNGRRVLALVRGSAVNQDGASNGLTAPNGPSQQRVIGQALASAGLSPEQVDAVEGHGTGTTLGDPIEVQALLATYGQARSPERPLWLGSVKSNIGHTQAAAGVAGVIKMVMGMHHGLLPRTLHVDEPSGNVDWSTGAVSLLSDEQPWGRGEEPRRAGVSSFGISGTNSHVIIEEAPELSQQEQASSQVQPSRREPASFQAQVSSQAQASSQRQPSRSAASFESSSSTDDSSDLKQTPWALTAKSRPALIDQAARLHAHLEAHPSVQPVDVGFSLLATRTAFRHRAVVLGRDRQALMEGLTALSDGAPSASVVEGVAEEEAERLAILFTGQGAQRVGMGRELYGRFPIFKSALDEACERLDGLLGVSLRAVMFGEDEPSSDRLESRVPSFDGHPGRSLLDSTDFTQAATFALEVALFRLVESLGLRPDFLMGHSIGELVAVHVADALSLEDACALVAARGRLMAALPPGGAMVALQISEQEALEQLADCDAPVSLAAVNGPHSVVLSGDERVVLELAGAWEAKGRKTRRLRVSHAFHSPRMEDMLEELLEVASKLTFEKPRVPVISNVTGKPIGEQELCAEYWVRHARQTVRFADGLQWLHSEGVGTYLELGPDGVLSSMAQESLISKDASEAKPSPEPGRTTPEGGEKLEAERTVERAPVAIPLLRAKRSEAQTLLHGLAQLWAGGARVEWSAVLEQGAEQVELPTYAFQRKRYWLEAERVERGDPASLGQMHSDHPLLGAAVALPDERGSLFTGRLSLEDGSWLADHAVMGAKLLPATAFVELALHVGEQLGCDSLDELTLVSPLVLAVGGPVQIQLLVGEPDPSGRRSFGVHSRSEPAPGEGSFEVALTCHATGTLAVDQPQRRRVSARAYEERQWPPQGAHSLDVDSLYDELLEHSFEYGPSFQGLHSAWQAGDSVFAEVALGDAEAEQAEHFGIHPALLDAALHAVALALPAGEADAPALPISLSGVKLHTHGVRRLRVRVSVLGEKEVSLVGFDETGATVVEIGALATRPATREQLAGSALAHSLFDLDWTPIETDDSVLPVERPWSLLEPDAGWLAAASQAAPWSLPVYSDLDSLVGAIADGKPPPEVVLAGCPTAPSIAGVQTPEDLALAETHANARWALETIQGWLACESLRTSRLVLLTHGALAATEGDRLGGLTHSPVWGLGGAAQSENPGRIVLVDLAEEESLPWELLAGTLDVDEPQIALRAGRVLAPRLRQMSSSRLRRIDAGSAASEVREGGGSIEDLESAHGARVEQSIPQLDMERTILITGGTGGIGALLARRLVQRHGARALLLTSRSGSQAPGASELVAELTELGAQVSVVACDVADRAQIRSLLEAIPDDRALGAVVHAAGVLDDGVIEGLSADRLASVLRPKVDGAMHLHELTAELDLSAFVLFSSASATLGAAGQGSYAAANAFLDTLASYRRSRGMVGISMAWGLWDGDAGMGARIEQADRARVSREGMRALSSEEGLDLFEASLASDSALILPMGLNMAPLRAQARSGNLPHIFRGLLRASGRRAQEGRLDSLASRLASVGDSERERIVLDVTLAHTAAVLGHTSVESIEPRQPFKDLGFDSLTAVELRNRLSAELASPLPATLVFDNPTPQAVSRYLLTQISTLSADAVSSFDAELAELQDKLSAIASDDIGRDRVATHLRAFLAELGDGQGAGFDGSTTSIEAEAQIEGQAQVENEALRVASAQEVFELIDRELGPLERDEGTHAIG